MSPMERALIEEGNEKRTQEVQTTCLYGLKGVQVPGSNWRRVHDIYMRVITATTRGEE